MYTSVQTTGYRIAKRDLVALSVQAWPQDAPEIQPRRSWSSQSQTPSQEAGQSTSVVADEGQYKFNAMPNGLQVSVS